MQTIDEEITAFAYAPDGRIVYSVRRLLKTKVYEFQRDDIWLQGRDGKRRRLVQGEKLIHKNMPFSYAVDSFRWSLDGHTILAQLNAILVTDERGNTLDARLGLLFDENGKWIRVADSKSFLFDTIKAAWLTDNETLVDLGEVVKPHLLFGIYTFRVTAGRGRQLFAGRTFVDADWIAKTNAGIAIERDRALTGPPRMQRLDLVKEVDTELATLEGYAGGLGVSPSGTKAAYYIDHEVLEIRDLAAPSRIARLRVGYGPFQWAPDEKRILLKRAMEKKSGDLVWIEVPPLVEESAQKREPDGGVVQPALTPILHGLAFRDFQISPDGRFLGVVPPGKRNLVVYPLGSL